MLYNFMRCAIRYMENYYEGETDFEVSEDDFNHIVERLNEVLDNLANFEKHEERADNG